MGDRVKISMVCEVCESRNYRTTKARRLGDDQRITLKKFCPPCGKHTLHKESR